MTVKKNPYRAHPFHSGVVNNIEFTIGAEASDVINVGIQFKDGNRNVAQRAGVIAYLSDDANGDSVTGTAPAGGVAVGTDGLAIPLVADKAFQLVSEADGHVDLDITNASTTPTFYLVVILPDGTLSVSDAITFA